MSWRWAAASEIGTSHIRTGSRLQDAYAVCDLGGDYVFAVVSDGAGSAEYGRSGAWIVCRHLKVCFRDWLAKDRGIPPDETVLEWIDDLRGRIALIAERRGSKPKQFAATLAALLISPDEQLALHIGDSSIAGRRGSDWEVICWPENGEYASTTFFVTDDPQPRLNIIRMSREHDAFALFSDGLGDLALSHLEQQAYPRFFDPMMRPVGLCVDRAHRSAEHHERVKQTPAHCRRHLPPLLVHGSYVRRGTRIRRVRVLVVLVG